jgi:hypothetical protein
VPGVIAQPTAAHPFNVSLPERPDAAPCASLAPMLNRRSLLLGLAAATAGAFVPRPAGATVARALSLQDLLRASRQRVLVTPVDQSALWERLGGRRRIVTYTVLRVDDDVDGRSAVGGELAVRTLGGQVGDIGQVVHGEAAFVPGERSTVFLEELGRGVYAVTGMAQGQYPTWPDEDGAERLHMSPHVGPLVRPGDAAVLRLHGQKLGDVRRMILRELGRHAP